MRRSLYPIAALVAAVLAFGTPETRTSPAGSGAGAGPAAPLTAAAVSAAADAGTPVGFDFGRYGVLRLRLRDSGVVTSRTKFTRTLADGSVRPLPGPRPRTLAGHVEGEPSSMVRLTVAKGWVAGMVQTSSRTIGIAPDDWNRPTRILLGEPEPAPPGAVAARDATEHPPAPVRSEARASAADPVPTPTPPTPLPTVTPLPTLTPLPTPAPTTIATSVPAPTPPTLPSQFPVAVWPTSMPSPAPSFTAPALSAGVYNCRVVKCNVVDVDVVLDADPLYTSAYGAAGCASRQAAVLNMADGVYMRPETRVHFAAVQVNCRTAPLPGTGTSTAAMLDRLRAAWDGTGPNRSVVHLAVGYDFAVSTPGDGIGRAYQPGVCGRLHPDNVVVADVPEVLTDRVSVHVTPTVGPTGASPGPTVGPIGASISAGPVDLPDVRCAFGYSLYQGVPRPGSNFTGTDPAFLILSGKISAHELGHNLNADHSQATGCKSTPPRTGTIMCDEFQEAGPNQFSANNAKRIRDWAEAKDGSITGS